MSDRRPQFTYSRIRRRQRAGQALIALGVGGLVGVALALGFRLLP